MIYYYRLLQNNCLIFLSVGVILKYNNNIFIIPITFFEHINSNLDRQFL